MPAGCTELGRACAAGTPAVRPRTDRPIAWQPSNAPWAARRREQRWQEAGTGQRWGRDELCTAAASASSTSTPESLEEVDVVVIGSGIGGLSCAGLLAKYGLKVGWRAGACAAA